MKRRSFLKLMGWAAAAAPAGSAFASWPADDDDMAEKLFEAGRKLDEQPLPPDLGRYLVSREYDIVTDSIYVRISAGDGRTVHNVSIGLTGHEESDRVSVGYVVEMLERRLTEAGLRESDLVRLPQPDYRMVQYFDSLADVEL